MKGGRAKSCLACGKAKQKCIGAVWEGGVGLNGVPMGADLSELTGLVRELVGEMRGMREELTEVKETVERGLRSVAKSSHSWYRTPVRDALDYAEWWEEFQVEEVDREYQELWKEDGLYFEFLKGRIDDEELDREVNERATDYLLGEDDLGAGPEERVPEVDLGEEE